MAAASKICSPRRLEDREEIGRAYLDAASHAYGGADGEGVPAPGVFAGRITSRLLVHSGDDPGRDILEGSADVAFIGGFRRPSPCSAGTLR